jgi:hypothetical protein
MGFDFFDIDEKEPPKLEKPKKETVKEECPYCGREYANLTRHIKNCPENPNREKKTKPSPKVKTPKTVDEKQLITDLRAQFEKSLSAEDKERISLEPEELEKIRDVIKFLGGTEGYQFIYKSITGDKIRGSMPYIIEECINWLKKHKLFLLWHKK